VAIVGRKQHCLRRLVVLGLGEEIHGEPLGRRCAIADDQDLRGTGEHVDTDFAEHLALRLRDVHIAGANDLVHARNGFGAIRKRTHGMGAPQRDDTVDARKGSGGEHRGIGIRAHHDELAHTGELRLHCVHQHR